MSDTKRKYKPNCAACDVESERKICYSAKGVGGKGCPTLTARETVKLANEQYTRPEVKAFARQAAIQEAECYRHRDVRPYILDPGKTRIVEIMEFARKMDYQRLGLAFCLGLMKEAWMVNDILLDNGFEVISAVCKVGRTSKEDCLGLKDEEKIVIGSDESMCNPILQAELLNEAQTDFNILLGLCVGHDSLFFQYTKAPVTVLAVKDRVTGHNPLAAVYTSHFYYQKVHHPETK